MKNETSWSTLILSNVMLTLPVTFSFAVLGGLAAAEFADFLDRAVHSIGLLAHHEEIRSRIFEYAVLGGFIVSQVCFASRYAQRADAPWPLIPFRPRLHLASALILTLAAGGLIGLNTEIHPETDTNRNYLTATQGWPFFFKSIVSSNPERFPGMTPQEIINDTEINYVYSNAVLNVLVCGDLLLVLLIVVECFLSRHERKSSKAAPASASTSGGSPLPASASAPGVLSS